jgi:hypothetical protein
MMGTMAVMGREGDTKVIWDSDNADEVANARRTFEDLVGRKRYLAFAVKKDGERGVQVSEFDPEAGKLILVPRLVGG